MNRFVVVIAVDDSCHHTILIVVYLHKSCILLYIVNYFMRINVNYISSTIRE